MISNRHPKLLCQIPYEVQKIIIKNKPSHLKHLDLPTQIKIIKDSPIIMNNLNINLQKTIITNSLIKIDEDLRIEFGDNNKLAELPGYMGLEHAAASNLYDKEISDLLEFADYRLKNNKDLMRAVVKRLFLGLRFASNNLKQDRELVLTAVGHFGAEIKYASNSLKNDQEVVFTALKNDISILSPKNHNKINITVQPDTSKKLIAEIRSNPQILNRITDNFFKGVSNTTLTIKQSLLRESILAKIFFNQHNLHIKTLLLLQNIKQMPSKIFFKNSGLYQSAWLSLGHIENKTYTFMTPDIPEDCINNIFCFIFPKYNNEELNIANLQNTITSNDALLNQGETSTDTAYPNNIYKESAYQKNSSLQKNIH